MQITKSDIQSRLENYAQIKRIFSKSLSERPGERWFQNIIIRFLYTHPKNLENLNKILSFVFDKVENVHLLEFNLKPSEKEPYDIDYKIMHVYAEILAAKLFVDSGFDSVTFLEKTISPTPDIKATKSGFTCFTEVKYLELTADELLPILFRLEELNIQFPEIYQKKRFVIKVKPSYLIKIKSIREKKVRDDIIDKIINYFNQKIHSEINNLENTLNKQEEYSIIVEKNNICVEFIIKKSDKFRPFLFGPEVHNHKLDASTEFYHYGPTYAKFLGRIHSAYLQLLANRNDNFELVKNDFVYLYLEEQSPDIFYQKEKEAKLKNLIEFFELNKMVNIVSNYNDISNIDIKKICPFFTETDDQSFSSTKD